MFYLFHTSYSPKRYLARGGTLSGGFAEVHTIDNVQFRPINWTEDQHMENSIFIGNLSDFPGDTAFDKEFPNRDNKVRVVSYVNK